MFWKQCNDFELSKTTIVINGICWKSWKSKSTVPNVYLCDGKQAPGDKKGGKTHILHFIFYIYDYLVKCIAIQPDILYLFATKQAPGDKKGGKTHILQPRQILCENCF